MVVEELFLVTCLSVAEVRYADPSVSVKVSNIEIWSEEELEALVEVIDNGGCLETSRYSADVADTEVDSSIGLLDSESRWRS